MLQILRSNQLLVVIIVVIYAVLFHLHAFLVPESWTPSSNGILSSFVYEWLDINSFSARIASTLLLILQALMVNRLANVNKIAKPFSYFPAGFYLLVSAYFHESGTLTPILMANTFYILAITELYKVYKKTNCTDNVFNVGLWVGVAGLFYFSMNIFLILGLLGLLSLRGLKIGDLLILVIGFFVPTFLVGTYFFWNDELSILIQHQIVENVGFLDFNYPSDWQFFARLGALVLFLLVTLASFQTYLNKQTIQSQKFITLLFAAMFVSFLSILVQHNIEADHFMILAVPLSIFLGMTFLSIKNRPIAEIFFIILFLLALCLQFNEYLLGFF